MGVQYLDAARQGKNDWWRYVLSIVVIAIFWLILGTIPLIIWGVANPHVFWSGGTTEFERIWFYAINSLSFVFFLLGLFVAVKGLHQRRFLTLIRANAHVRFKRMAQGAGVWGLLIALPYLIEAILFPSHFAITFHASAWFVLLPIALILTPIQSTTEELFFRGYLLQSLGIFTKNHWILMSLTSIFFAVLHFGNPEVEASSSFTWIALNYLSFGVFFALITLKDNALELAIGAHVINNLFLGLVVSPKVSVLNTPAIVTQTVIADARIELILLLAQASIFYYVFFGRRRINQNNVNG